MRKEALAYRDGAWNVDADSHIEVESANSFVIIVC